MFIFNEGRNRNPLMSLSIFRVKGLAAADVTWLIGMAGFFSMFFFLTLYMQEVLRYSPIQAGAAYLPVTVCLALAAGVSSQLFTRIGTRPVIVAGALLSAGGIYYLSRVPLHGSYLPDILPGLVMMALGFGAVFVGTTTAANAGVPSDKAGLAAGLLSHLPTDRDGARARGPVGDRDRPHAPFACDSHGTARGAHLGISARAARRAACSCSSQP